MWIALRNEGDMSMCSDGTRVILTLLWAIGLHYVALLLVMREQRVYVRTKTSSVTFKVKACGDIKFHLNMLQPDGTLISYQCILRGYNGKRGFIRLDDTFLVKGEPASLRHCQEYRPYWASWEKGVLSSGTGWTVGQGVLLEYSTEFTELHLLWMNVLFWKFKETRYNFDDQNAAFLKRTPRFRYKGRTSYVVVTTRSKSEMCRGLPRRATMCGHQLHTRYTSMSAGGTIQGKHTCIFCGTSVGYTTILKIPPYIRVYS